MSAADPLFAPLAFRALELPNRVLRSSMSGRFDTREQMVEEIFSVYEPAPFR